MIDWELAEKMTCLPNISHKRKTFTSPTFKDIDSSSPINRTKVEVLSVPLYNYLSVYIVHVNGCTLPTTANHFSQIFQYNYTFFLYAITETHIFGLFFVYLNAMKNRFFHFLIYLNKSKGKT